MVTKCIFVAYADHEMNPEHTNFFTTVCTDLKHAGLEVYSRPNMRGMSGAAIKHAVEHGLHQCDNVAVFVNRHSTSVWDVRWRAVSAGKAVLYLLQEDCQPTRTVLGYVEDKEIKLTRYRDEHD